MLEINCRPRKSIQIAVSGSVDITRVRPIVDHLLFQKMRYRLQIGEVHVVYPDAGHKRFTHSLGVMKWTERRMRRWERWGLVDQQDKLDAETFGCLHDIGHGPRSHLVDSLVSKDHEERAIAILEELRECILQAGANPDRIIAMMKRMDPLAVAVLHTPLGTDKLDYLARDAHFTALDGMPSEEPFLDQVYYVDGKLVVDIKIYENIKQLIQFYWMMYAQVYFRPAVILSERYLQRMISQLLGQTGDEPEFGEDDLVQMTDSDLDYRLSHAKNPMVREASDRYLRREQPQPALLFQHDPFHEHNWAGTHPIRYLRFPPDFFTKKSLRNPGVLYALERKIEDALGLSHQSVLAVPPVPARRFEPQEVLFRTDNGIVPLKEISPEQWEFQLQESRRYARFYIGTYLEQCPVLSEMQTAQKVADIVFAHFAE